MKLSASPMDGIELILEEPHDWLMVMAVLHDANDRDFDLAGSLGAVAEASGQWEDWKEWVLPDLREGFADNLRHVVRAIKDAQSEAFPGPGTIKIPPDDYFPWYATLNQARLALEAKHRLTADPPAPDQDADRWAAFVRSQFYSMLQSQFLNLGLG